jgi:hypothetical protein
MSGKEQRSRGLQGLVRVHWVDRVSGGEGHGDPVTMELASDYLRRNQAAFAQFEFSFRDAVSGELVTPVAREAAVAPAALGATGGEPTDLGEAPVEAVAIV